MSNSDDDYRDKIVISFLGIGYEYLNCIFAFNGKNKINHENTKIFMVFFAFSDFRVFVIKGLSI